MMNHVVKTVSGLWNDWKQWYKVQHDHLTHSVWTKTFKLITSFRIVKWEGNKVWWFSSFWQQDEFEDTTETHKSLFLTLWEITLWVKRPVLVLHHKLTFKLFKPALKHDVNVKHIHWHRKDTWPTNHQLLNTCESESDSYFYNHKKIKIKNLSLGLRCWN